MNIILKINSDETIKQFIERAEEEANKLTGKVTIHKISGNTKGSKAGIRIIIIRQWD